MDMTKGAGMMNKNIIAQILADTLPKIGYLNKYETGIIYQIINCQTSVLGGHKYECIKCGRPEIFYNSCHNRHCPNCQSALRIKWVRKRLLELLPVQYFHAVFTIPGQLRSITLYNKTVMLNLIFKCVHETLKQAAINKANLGARIGGISVLHTWDQVLNYHPHIHCIIPGGGLSLDNRNWISSKEGFFIPVRILSIIFRARMLKALYKIYNSLRFSGKIKKYAHKQAFKHMLKMLKKKKWVVYCKRPFAHAGKIVNYLGKYTHRIGISNGRIISYKHGLVWFEYKDRKTNQKKICSLDAVTFTKRFILHILPKRFFKIRQFGILANSNRKKFLPIIKRLLFEGKQQEASMIADKYLKDLSIYDNEPELKCPECGGCLIYCFKLAPLVYKIPNPINKREDDTG
jgi:hypothetical protein